MIRILENILLYKSEILILIVMLAPVIIFPILLRRMLKKRMITLEEANRKLANDLHERRRQESGLLDSWAFMKNVINSIGDPIDVRDSNSTFVLANEAYCRLVERDPGALRLDAEDTDVISQSDGNNPDSAYELIREERIVDAEGHEHIFLVKKRTFVDGAGKSYIVGIRRDITEQRETEEALRTSYLKLEDRVYERSVELRNAYLNINREIMERRLMEKVLTTQLRYERALSDSLKDLLPGCPEAAPLERVMEHLQKASGAMRVYYYDWMGDDVYGPRAVKRCEALAITEGAEIKGSKLGDSLVGGTLRRWSEMLANQRPIMGTLDDFPPAESDFLKSEGVSSILLLPTLIDDRWNGLIGFDNSWKRLWTEEEINLLKTAAKMISLYLERVKADVETNYYQERLLNHAAELSLAEERERRRIASLLHDDIGQTLAHCMIKLELMTHLPVCPDSFSQNIPQVTALLAESITRLRSLTTQLSPPLLYDIGFGAALMWLGERFHDEHGLCVEIRGDNIRKELNESISVTLFQVVRELMTNVVKHAKAENIIISTEKRNNMLKISCVDDGIGFDVREAEKKAGFGLFNVRQKIGHLGGEIRIESKSGCGTSVFIFAPFNDENTASYSK